jgi:hypothetical protein
MLVGGNNVNKKISDPSIFLLLGFGFGLAVLGVQQLMPTNPNLIAAATYATLVAAIAEFGGGIWAFARKDTYLGAIGTTFGAWLIGYYMLVTAGVATKIYSPRSAALYCFALIIPVALLAIPSIKLKLKVFTGVFVFLILLLFFLGMAGMPFADGTTIWAKLGGVSALITALLLWWSALGAIKGLLAEMMAPPPAA